MTGDAADRSWWSRLAGASAANLGLQVAATALGLVTSVLLGRWLGADGMGVYAFAFALVNILGVLARLGLEIVTVRDVAVLLDQRDGSGLRGLASFAPRAGLVAGVTIGAIAVGVVALTGADAATVRTTAVAMGLLVALTLVSLHGAILRGLHHTVIANVPANLVRPVAFAAAVGGLWWAGASSEPELAMASHLAAGVIALVVATVARERYLPDWVRDAAPRVEVRRWMTAAAPMLVLGGLGVLNRQLDVVMMKSLSTDAETGVYAIAVQLSTFISMVLTALNLVIAPRFASLHAAGRTVELQRLVATSSAIVTAGTVPIAVVLVGLSPWLLPFWGHEFVDARIPFAILAAGNVVNALSGSVGYLLIMSGNERLVARVFAAVAALNIVLNAVLIPRLGAPGAATATAVSMALWNLTLIVLVRRRLGINSTVFAWLTRGSWGARRG